MGDFSSDILKLFLFCRVVMFQVRYDFEVEGSLKHLDRSCLASLLLSFVSKFASSQTLLRLLFSALLCSIYCLIQLNFK